MPPILMAVCWAMLIAAFLRGGHPSYDREVDFAKSPDVTHSTSRLGLLVVCALLGAGLGFGLNLVGDDLLNSPYRSVISVVGGCLLGVLIALAMDVAARRRP